MMLSCKCKRFCIVSFLFVLCPQRTSCPQLAAHWHRLTSLSWRQAIYSTISPTPQQAWYTAEHDVVPKTSCFEGFERDSCKAGGRRACQA